MPRLSDQLPRFLLGKYQLTATVTFAAFWSLVFLVLSIPFSHNAWFALGRNEAFIFTVVFYLLSLAIVSCSNMAKYALRGSDNFTVLRFILWAAGEIVLISLIYSFFTVEGKSTESSPPSIPVSAVSSWAPWRIPLCLWAFLM